MKTKNFLFALLMSMCSVLPSYSMDEENVVIVLTKIGNLGSGGGPRSEIPITASMEDGIITTESNTYSGTVSVVIKDEDGDTVLSTAENVSANSQFTTNISSLADGSYTIYYTLGDIVYYGVFEKN